MRVAVVLVLLIFFARIGRRVPAWIPESNTSSPSAPVRFRLPAPPTQMLRAIGESTVESFGVITAPPRAGSTELAPARAASIGGIGKSRGRGSGHSGVFARERALQAIREL